MKTILCYGDSNTYGYDPATGRRYPADVRWTGVLRGLLGQDFSVIEEGCNGRTSVFLDPVEGWKRGIDYLRPCLNTHKPVDLVVLMLGTNDLKVFYHASLEDIVNGVAELIDIIHDFTAEKQDYRAKVLLVAPALIGEDIENSPFNSDFDRTAIERSKGFAMAFEDLADRKGCLYFDAAKVAKVSELDQLHLSKEAHGNLARGLYEVIKDYFGPSSKAIT